MARLQFNYQCYEPLLISGSCEITTDVYSSVFPLEAQSGCGILGGGRRVMVIVFSKMLGLARAQRGQDRRS